MNSFWRRTGFGEHHDSAHHVVPVGNLNWSHGTCFEYHSVPLFDVDQSLEPHFAANGWHNKVAHSVDTWIMANDLVSRLFWTNAPAQEHKILIFVLPPPQSNLHSGFCCLKAPVCYCDWSPTDIHSATSIETKPWICLMYSQHSHLTLWLCAKAALVHHTCYWLDSLAADNSCFVLNLLLNNDN